MTPVASALRELGVQKAHRIGVLTGTTPLHVAMHAARLASPFTLVPLHVRAPEPAVAAQAERCGVEALVADEAWAEAAQRLAATLGDVPVVVATEEGEVVRMPPGGLPRPAVPDGGVAAVVQTSGTTGTPRAVALPEACLAAHAEAASERLRSGADSTWLAVLPLSHVGGLALVDRALRTDARIVLLPRFDPRRVLATLRGEDVTHVSLVPTMLARLLDEGPPEALTCALVGGDRTPPDLVLRALDAGWPVHPTYGLTEACSQVATATPEQARARPGSVGRPLRGLAVRAVRDDGTDAAPGEEGELEVRGPTVPQGRCRTGDRGTVDADGWVTVTGRMLERIVTGGENVDARAVEDVLLEQGVVEAAVVGVPDATWGERVAAAVVLRGGEDGEGEGVDGGGDVEDRLAEAVRKRLGDASVPRAWAFVDALPRTAVGKPARAAVRALFQTDAV